MPQLLGCASIDYTGGYTVFTSRCPMADSDGAYPDCFGPRTNPQGCGHFIAFDVEDYIPLITCTLAEDDDVEY